MKAVRLSPGALFLAGILILGFLVRVFGVHFGLPHLYHADEPVVVNHALAYGTGDLNPHFFNIPPLVSYLLFFCYGIFYAMGRGTGFFHSAGDLERLFYTDPTAFYLIARGIFGVLLGTVSIYLLYRLVKRFWTSEKALLAALLLAVNFLHARDSHYVYVDIPLLCVLLAGFEVIFRMGETPGSRKWHLACGGMIGLATATKYNGVFLAIPYLWICLRVVPREKWIGAWALAAGTAAAVFAALNPYAVVDHSFFIKEITEQSAANSGGLPFFHPLKYSLAGAMGLVVLTIAAAGWIRAVFSKKPVYEAVAVFVLGYYLVLFKWGQPYDRYALPLVPFLCILAADFLFSRRTELSHGKLSLTPVLWVLVIGVIVWPSCLRILRWDLLMAAPDTRTVARAWIEENVPDGSRIALDGTFFMPRLSFSEGQLKEKLAGLDGSGGQAGAKKRRLEFLLAESFQPSYEIYFMSSQPGTGKFLFGEPEISYDVAALRQKGVEYVLVADGARGGAPAAFLDELKKTARPVVKFSPYRRSGDAGPYDVQPLTGGPFLAKDIRARKRNGYPLAVYKFD